jgi:LmbE family N-acetylglucosaminyl deacetylase
VRKLRLFPDTKEAVTFLFLGAHCDDIEIGCGGTLLRLVKEYPNSRFVWVVLSSDTMRAKEVRQSYARFLDAAADKRLHIEQFRNGYFPYVGASIKDYFEQLKSKENPDLIFTHYRHDLHQDHRLVSELTWNTFRDHCIFEYEVPKYDGDVGSPNVFFSITRETGERKADYIEKCYRSQHSHRWFTRETFLALMRLRGIECNAEEGLAEAYYCRKLIT